MLAGFDTEVCAKEVSDVDVQLITLRVILCCAPEIRPYVSHESRPDNLRPFIRRDDRVQDVRVHRVYFRDFLSVVSIFSGAVNKFHLVKLLTSFFLITVV